VILFFSVSLLAQALTRRALIIGNGQYMADDGSSGFPNLPMTSRDANAVGAVLEENGFEHADVTILTDQTFAGMITALSDFSKSLKPNDSALFYFSGHGFALDGENYIVPVGFQFGENKASAIRAAISLQRVLKSIERAKTRVVILDACRDEPPLPKGLDASSTHSFGHLVPTQGSGSLVAFATSYGSTASGASASGLSFYTQFLVQSLTRHPPNMRTALDDAKSLLMNADPDAPPPGIYNEMRGDFPLAGSSFMETAPDQFVHIDADASSAYAWVLRVQAISPVQHYDIKIQAVLLGITAGTVRTVLKPLVLDLRPGNVPNNYVAYPDGMGREAAICYTARASGQSAPMRLTEVFKVQSTSSGAVLVPNHEPTLGPASDAPCGDAHVIQTFQQQQEAAAKEAAMAHPASPRAKPAPAANMAGTYYDPSTSLMWTLKDSGSGVNYADARNYCTNLELAGFRDWRLPLEEELQALYDPNNPRKLTGPSQRLETVFVRGTIELSGDQVWSGTPSTKTLSGYKMVQAFGFTNNRAFSSIVVTTERVLCVRNNE
jgi:hypothetical protein